MLGSVVLIVTQLMGDLGSDMFVYQSRLKEQRTSKVKGEQHEWFHEVQVRTVDTISTKLKPLAGQTPAGMTQSRKCDTTLNTIRHDNRHLRPASVVCIFAPQPVSTLVWCERGS